MSAELALMDFLGIDPKSNVTKIEVIAISGNPPEVIVTRLLLDDSSWEQQSRMFKLVPYES
jgi:hypothetical protein